MNHHKEKEIMGCQRAYNKRANETPEESKKRRAMEAERANKNRGNETPEKRIARKEAVAKRAKLTHINASPESARKQREKNTEKVRKYRLTQTNVSPESARKKREKNTEMVRKYRLKKKASREAHKDRLRRQVVRSANQSCDLGLDEIEEEVPNISQYVETRESIIAAYEHLMKTQLKENEKFESVQMRPGIDFPLAGMRHQANVCVCCDRFITGTNEIKWINKTVLLSNEKRLQDDDITVSLQNCYNVLDPGLQHCLLSPRARVKSNDDYMCCSQCKSFNRYSYSVLH